MNTSNVALVVATVALIVGVINFRSGSSRWQKTQVLAELMKSEGRSLMTVLKNQESLIVNQNKILDRLELDVIKKLNGGEAIGSD